MLGAFHEGSWMITSTDSDQVMHVLFAMSTGHICRTGPEKVDVAVRQKKTNGKVEFILANRVYQAICDEPKWGGEQTLLEWLTSQAKVALFTLVFFLGGCDFLPAIYNMPFSRMLRYVVETIADPGLFTTPMLVRDEGPGRVDGPWVVETDECVKLLCVCYFQLHRNIFRSKYPGGAAEMFMHPDIGGRVPDFARVVTEIIWVAKGASGKQNCPHYDALQLHVRRGATTMLYYYSALESQAKPVKLEGQGWATHSGKPGEAITRDIVVIQLSTHALLGKGGCLKILTCGCKPKSAEKHECKNCKCGSLGKSCVFGYSKCDEACRLWKGGVVDSVETVIQGAPGWYCDSDDGGSEVMEIFEEDGVRTSDGGDARWDGSDIGDDSDADDFSEHGSDLDDVSEHGSDFVDVGGDGSDGDYVSWTVADVPWAVGDDSCYLREIGRPWRGSDS